MVKDILIFQWIQIFQLTQNPNKGEFRGKRQDLGIRFLSRFQKIIFPDFDKNEYKDIKNLKLFS